MNEQLQLILTAVLLGLGVLSILLGILGVYRFKFIMNRIHCAALIDTFGAAFIIAGLVAATWSMDYVPKLLGIIGILWIGSPIASHLVSKLEIATDETVPAHMEIVNESEYMEAGEEPAASAVETGEKKK